MSELTTIQVDFEVFQKIQLEKQSFSDADIDALRRLLGMPAPANPSRSHNGDRKPPEGISLRYNVFLPGGTELRMRYRGKYHFGKVENGHMCVNNKEFKGPSPAAVEIIGGHVNGWNYWEVRFPGASHWEKLVRLRK